MARFRRDDRAADCAALEMPAHILVCFLAYVLWKTLAALVRQAWAALLSVCRTDGRFVGA